VKRYLAPGQTEPEVRPVIPVMAPVILMAPFVWMSRGPLAVFVWLAVGLPCAWAVITNWAPGRKAAGGGDAP
jgi:hypothetical protein